MSEHGLVYDLQQEYRKSGFSAEDALIEALTHTGVVDLSPAWYSGVVRSKSDAVALAASNKTPTLRADARFFAEAVESLTAYAIPVDRNGGFSHFKWFLVDMGFEARGVKDHLRYLHTTLSQQSSRKEAKTSGNLQLQFAAFNEDGGRFHRSPSHIGAIPLNRGMEEISSIDNLKLSMRLPLARVDRSVNLSFPKDVSGDEAAGYFADVVNQAVESLLF